MENNKLSSALLILLYSIFLICCKNTFPDYGYSEFLFSHKGGSYSENFKLSLNARADEKVYYTLDGSEPTVQSLLYNEPITIQAQNLDCSGKTTVDLYDEKKSSDNPLMLIFSAPLDAGYESENYKAYNYYKPFIPVGSFPLATVVKAQVYKNGFAQSPVETHTFWVGDPPTSTIPVVSLSINRENFVGWDDGIYVPGKNFNPETIFSGNYFTGWERPAHFEYFLPDGTLAYQADVGIRVGGQNPQVPIKLLRIFSRSEYGASWLNYRFFDDKNIFKYKRLNLRAGGFPEFIHAYFTDDIAQNLLKNSILDIQYARPVIVYINGEYWGLHSLKDRLDKYYLQTKYSLSEVERNNIDYFNDGEYDEGDSCSWDSLMSLINALEADGSISDDDCSYIAKYVDLENLYTLVATQIYYSNIDWPLPWNDRRWRLRIENGSGTGVRDGRWRWMLFDLDAAFGGYWLNNFVSIWKDSWITADTNEHSLPTDRLLLNKKQCINFLNIMCDLLNSVFREELVQQSIADFYKDVSPYMADHIRRWGYPDSLGHWQSCFDSLNNFALYRPDNVRTLARIYFCTAKATLPELGVPVNISLICSGKGMIKINTLSLTTDTDDINGIPWSGVYYSNIPITLKAEAKRGYRFIFWLFISGISLYSGSTTSESVEVKLTSNAIAIAVFIQG